MATATEKTKPETQAATQTAMVPAAKQSDLAQYMPEGAVPALGYWCNFPAEPMARFRLVAACNGSQVEKASEWIGVPFALSRWYIQPVELTNEETGEVNNAFRVVLINENGGMVGFVSQGILKSLALVIQTFGPGPWTPGIPVVLRQLDLGKNRRLYTLEAAD